MGILRLAVLVLAATSTVLAQASPQSPPTGPTFDVVSIKQSVTNRAPANVNQRPDGGIIMTNIPVGMVISRAYPFAPPMDMVGLPGWAMSELYDVSATSSLPSATPDQHAAMLRAMLANRFRLAVHIENRERPVYDLALARVDGRLSANGIWKAVNKLVDT